MTLFIAEATADVPLHREWEKTEKFKGFTVAELRRVFDAVCNADNWKAPWAATLPHQHVPAVTAAVEYFHADTPTVDAIVPISGHVRMSGRGYQA